MKGVVSRTISTLILAGVAGLFGVLFLAYKAGARSGGVSILQFGAMPQEAGVPLTIAALLCVAISITLILILRARVVSPVEQLAKYSQELAAGDSGAQLYLP